jgi:hypothetical protein
MGCNLSIGLKLQYRVNPASEISWPNWPWNFFCNSSSRDEVVGIHEFKKSANMEIIVDRAL